MCYSSDYSCEKKVIALASLVPIVHQLLMQMMQQKCHIMLVHHHHHLITSGL